MSELIERLEKAGQGSPTPMGFGAMAHREVDVGPFLVVATMSLEELDPPPAEAPADAYLVEFEVLHHASRAGQTLEGRLWGARLPSLDRSTIEALKEAGCDFVVLSPESTEGAVLLEEDIGKLVAVEPGLDEDTARAINDLPLDGVVFRPHGALRPLTVQRLMDLDKDRSLLDRPFLLEAAEPFSPEELDALRELGIYGLLAPLKDWKTLEALRRSVEALPRRRRRAGRGERPTAYVPKVTSEEEPYDDEP